MQAACFADMRAVDACGRMCSAKGCGCRGMVWERFPEHTWMAAIGYAFKCIGSVHSA